MIECEAVANLRNNYKLFIEIVIQRTPPLIQINYLKTKRKISNLGDD